MSMRPWRGRLALSVAAAATLGVVASADAATTVRIDSGRTNLAVPPTTSRALRAAGITLGTAGPARRTGRRIGLPIRAGRIDPATAKGTVVHAGAIVLRAGRARVRLTNVTVDTARRTFSARLGRRTVVLGNARGGRVVRAGVATRLNGLRLAFSRRGAAALGRALRVRAPRLVLGRATVLPVSGEVALARGETVLTFTRDALLPFAVLRIGVTAIPPATQERALGPLRFPVGGGTLTANRLLGTVRHDGAVAFTPQGRATAQFGELALTLGERSTLSTTIGTIADVDLSAATKTLDPDTRTVSLTGLRVRLNPFAAGALNGVFATHLFHDDQEFATLQITASVR